MIEAHQVQDRRVKVMEADLATNCKSIRSSTAWFATTTMFRVRGNTAAATFESQPTDPTNPLHSKFRECGAKAYQPMT